MNIISANASFLRLFQSSEQEIALDLPASGSIKLRLNARRIHERGIAKDRILLAMEPVTQKG